MPSRGSIIIAQILSSQLRYTFRRVLSPTMFARDLLRRRRRRQQLAWLEKVSNNIVNSLFDYLSGGFFGLPSSRLNPSQSGVGWSSSGDTFSQAEKKCNPRGSTKPSQNILTLISYHVPPILR